MRDDIARFLIGLVALVVIAGLSSAALAWLGLATVKEVVTYFASSLVLLLVLEAGRWLERNGH